MTIRDDTQLRQAMEALQDLRLGIAALRRDVPNQRNFAMMIEGSLDEIARIEADINEYLGLDERAELWMRVTGTGIAAGDAPTAVLTSLLDGLRKGLQAATEHAHTGTLSARPTAQVQRAVDVRLTAIAPGSLRIGLNVESEAQQDLAELGGLQDAARRSLREYLEVLAWAGRDLQDEEAFQELEALIPDAERRRLLLALVLQLAPRARGAVDTVEMSGRVVPDGRSPTLTRASRDRLAAAIDRTEQQAVREDIVGQLRELDLDRRTGTVRRENEPETLCEFTEELVSTAQEALGRTVLVIGHRNEGSRRRSSLLVTRMEIVDDAKE